MPDAIAPQSAFASACPTNLIELSPEPEPLAGGRGGWLGGRANPAVRHASTCRRNGSAVERYSRRAPKNMENTLPGANQKWFACGGIGSSSVESQAPAVLAQARCQGEVSFCLAPHFSSDRAEQAGSLGRWRRRRDFTPIKLRKNVKFHVSGVCRFRHPGSRAQSYMLEQASVNAKAGAICL